MSTVLETRTEGPASELDPYRVPCGPSSTSMRWMS